MRPLTFMLLVLILAACSGCMTIRVFNCVSANLKSERERIPAGTQLKIGVTCSGTTVGGHRYITFSFRHQRCWLVLFYPRLESGGWLRTDTTSDHTSAWLVTGRKPDGAALAHEVTEATFLPRGAERLRGSFEIQWRNADDFYVTTELVGEGGQTAMSGQLAAYKALWRPLIVPAMLFGFGGGPRAPKP